MAWTHNYFKGLNVLAAQISLILSNAQSFIFKSVSGIWQPDADVKYTLTELKDAGGARTGWKVTTPDDTVETYSAIGDLLTITDRSGMGQTLAYSTCTTVSPTCPTPTPDPDAPFDGLLTKVTDSFGRRLNFTYNQMGQMVKVSLSSLSNPMLESNTTQYSYDSNGNLKTVTYPDNSTKTYHYGGDAGEAGNVSATPDIGVTYTHALTGITDENNVRFATYKYDGSGKAVSTEHAGVVEKYGLTYLPDDPNTTGVIDPVTHITDPLNSVRSTHFKTVLGVLKPTGTDQPGGSGCSAASSAITYDANGNVESRTDYNGHKACYAYDLTRNLETKRVEGLASVADCPSVLADGAVLPANARKTSTAWHPDWRLPVKVAEPKKLTTYVYNGQVDPSNGAIASCAPASALVDGKPIAVLCKKAEQATSDAAGAAGLSPVVGGPVRAWTYTYNAVGQVLTANGPRGDVLDRTTSTYYADTQFDAATGLGHTQGDLWKTTNALGQVTTFNSYDKNGRPTQITEANGVATTLDYTPRGWLKALAVAAPDNSNVETTQYTYEPTGLPKTVTQPDGNVLTYGYDDAHRLQAVTDSLGNKVVYTLDNMGNRLKETYWDPGSAAQPDESVSAVGLRRKISRSYDALDRLQTLTTGAGQ